MSTRDYAYEALAEVTSTDMTAGRGQLNAALKSIRAQSEIEDSYLLGAEIHERAKMYRSVFPEMALTPTALAKHYLRVYEESKPRPVFANPPPLPEREPSNLDQVKALMQQMGWR